MVEGHSRRRVVVTGIGALTPVGNSAQETWESFVAGRSGVGLVQAFDTTDYPVRIGAEVKGFDPLAHIPPKEARRIARCTQLAIVAGRQAVADAGLVWDHEDRERAAVLLGTGFGGVELLVDPIQKSMGRGFIKISPHIPIECLCNLPAFHVGLEHGCLGPLSTVVTACAAGTQALGEASEWIRRGAADIVLAGGTESQMNPLFYVGFTSMRVLSARNDEPERASRPFDADRDGFVIGEGSVIVVLEEMEHAVQRGARIYAELIGQAASADAYHVAQPQADGAGPARCMRWALADAGIQPEQVQYINAHGSATVQNDAAETAAIKGVFGEHAYRLAVGSTKSMIGHLFGAAGAVEALATIMAVHTDTMHPTINYETPDPACDLDYIPNVARRQSVDFAMSNSFGLGGQNASLVFCKWH